MGRHGCADMGISMIHVSKRIEEAIMALLCQDQVFFVAD